MTKISIFGAGAFGTALSIVQANAGRQVDLVCRSDAAAAQLIEKSINAKYLPNIEIPSSVQILSKLAPADIYLWSVPAQNLAQSLDEHALKIAQGAWVVICAKGLNNENHERLSVIASRTVPHAKIAVLSGPAFAVDLARGHPTAVTVAAAQGALELCEKLSTDKLRCYASNDVVGVELGGALKNVIAIAAGAVLGAGLGESARAALITRGFSEIRAIASAMGAQADTLMGLSGLGDLLLTASSEKSRNTRYGLALGGGTSLPETLAEGVKTAPAALKLAKKLGIEAPILEKITQLIIGEMNPEDAVSALMTRPLRAEN